jgi:glyoxylase-like metal-dependent hydrolase (beta-lactamase superfamily II)
MLQVISFVLGPVATNTYLIADDSTGEAAVIDPAWDGEMISAEAQHRGWRIEQIWITHAHFDHIAGVGAVLAACKPPVTLALHPADLPLWRMKGGAELFGIRLEATAQPDVLLQPGQILRVGQFEFEVRHTPGHSAGHVIFYCAAESLAFCGDTVFASSIGRTDLPGGDEETLIESIRRQILTLPDDTRLLGGHGEETCVGIEKRTNLYLR